MADAVRLDERFSIITDAERLPLPPRVLKADDTFGVFDQYGDIVPSENSEQGLYHRGTRYLSRLELLMGRRRPLLLSSTIDDQNSVFSADSTNGDVFQDDVLLLARGELHIARKRVLAAGGSVEQVRVSNHARHPVEVPITLRLDADYADIFEVRGTARQRRGERLDDTWGTEFAMRYAGLDGVERRTRVRVSRVPDRLEPGRATFRLLLDPRESADIEISVVMEQGSEQCPHLAYNEMLEAARQRVASLAERGAEVSSSNASFNRWLTRSAADLRMMLTHTPHGTYPYAGIPWYSTPFGRDGLITARELLWVDPHVARSVLLFLAKTQATERSDAADAQPGKIVHEMRDGEMAALGEVPFGRYYGTADATPFFVMLAHHYYVRTGDETTLDGLWPHILAALQWMETDGDPDGDGFIEYARRSSTGLVQQGWKDSDDSIFHADGALAEPPIALCEIQAYAYGAWVGASQLAQLRGHQDQAVEWRKRASALRERFDAAFWCEDLGTYALALDGAKRPCRVRSSNAGHCLLTGLARTERARRLTAELMAEASCAGWGIRTIARGEARYNPMSYHNGSIWPHDNALIAAGFARYGFTQPATQLLSAMFDLSQAVDLHRLPELICGFERGQNDSPTLYPVACAPQAWAAGVVFLLLEACLGLRIDAATRRVTLRRAVLPETIEWLRITGLAVGDGTVDLLLERHPHDVGVKVLNREGDVEIVAVK